MFLDTTPDLLETLRRASEDRHVETLRTASHTLKSSSAAIGALALSRRCADLETVAREGRVTEAGTLVEAIILEFERIKPSIEAQAMGAEVDAAV